MTTSKVSIPYKYKLRFFPEALEEWYRLDGSVRAPLKKLLAKRLNKPHVPGGELHGELAGCYKIKLRKQGVRLIYSVENDHLIVTVVAVDKRENGVAYQSAVTRLTVVASAVAKARRDSIGASLKGRQSGAGDSD